MGSCRCGAGRTWPQKFGRGRGGPIIGGRGGKKGKNGERGERRKKKLKWTWGGKKKGVPQIGEDSDRGGCRMAVGGKLTAGTGWRRKKTVFSDRKRGDKAKTAKNTNKEEGKRRKGVQPRKRREQRVHRGGTTQTFQGKAVITTAQKKNKETVKGEATGQISKKVNVGGGVKTREGTAGDQSGFRTRYLSVPRERK